MSPIDFFVLSALLFGIGIFGIVARRNVISLFFSLELILNSANVLLVGFSSSTRISLGKSLSFLSLRLLPLRLQLDLQ
jgi:NADH-quinone oxidoreductase subunit K